MSQKKVIIMDIDGTLLNSSRVMTPKTKETLMKAQQKGIKLILASGRQTAGLIPIAKELQMDCYHGLLVSYNGSRVIDCQNGEILFDEPLSVEMGKAVLEHMKNFQVYPMIDKGSHLYVNNVYAAPIHSKGKCFNVIEHEARGCNFLLCEQKDLASFLDYKVNKVLTAGEPEYLQEHYQEMMEPFKDTLSCMFTSDFYFEFTAQGIDKGKALDSVLKPMGYTQDEMISFGDGMNDISMIRYAGTGVAMGNAVQGLKEVADDITTTNDEDGIVEALWRYIPELQGE